MGTYLSVMANQAKTMDEVLMELDRIIDTSVTENSFLGIFAYVYRRTTARIKQAILDNQFEDNERLEKMDVAFANLYLSAYQRFENNIRCSKSWKTAFEAKHEKITIIQHLLLGMNAHINLDLGIAAATIAPGDNLPGIKNDFMKVNQILNDLTNEMQDRMAKVSRLMILADWAGKNSDEAIVNFSMVKAREQSWNLACVLAVCNENEKQSVVEIADQTISNLGFRLKNPPGYLLKMALKIIAYFEEKNVKIIINKLREDDV
jgi:hypothetical protein